VDSEPNTNRQREDTPRGTEKFLVGTGFLVFAALLAVAAVVAYFLYFAASHARPLDIAAAIMLVAVILYGWQEPQLTAIWRRLRRR